MKVLFTCLPGYGHFLPMVPLARATATAGHRVVFATAKEFLPRIEGAGFEGVPAGMSLEDQLEEAGRRLPEARQPPGKQRFVSFVPRMLAGVAAPSRAADLAGIVADLGPDLLVHDETEFAGPLAATVAGIPYADQSVGILRPLEMARLAADVIAPLWKDAGLSPPPFGGLFGYLYLDVCPPSLQSPEIAEVGVAHPVQNLSVDPAGRELLPEWMAALPDVPTVYVSLGTIFNRDPGVFSAILDGLREEAVNVIVTIGHGNDPTSLGPQPPNVHVEQYIPQVLLLPYCDAVVNQGGTAILDILGHGLPLLVVPQSANQFHNAEACTQSGVGRALQPGEVTPEAVRREIRTLLGDPTYRQAARRVQEELAAMPGPEEGTRLLERLAQERTPLVTAGRDASA